MTNRVKGSVGVFVGAAVIAVLAASLALAAPARASDRAHASIIGGSPAAEGEWPWAAFILALDRHGNGFSCTGSVVAPTLILTAGHCVEDLGTGLPTPADRYAVVTGSADVRNATARVISKVSRTVLYPGFSRNTLHGDAALLVLSEPVSAPALALAGTDDAALVGDGAPTLVAGWGLTSGNPKSSQPAVLRKAKTFVQPTRYCVRRTRIYYPYFDPSSQLCTITPRAAAAGTCHGDSGGPALAFRSDATPVQVGITSLGAGNCDTNVPDIFTRVDRISSWIESWIAAAETGQLPSAPTPHLPTMSTRQALYLAELGLSRDFRNVFRHGGDFRARCRRVGAEKGRCGVTWFRGAFDYFGYVTVYYAFSDKVPTWKYRYTIHWVNDRCYFLGPHPRRCAVHTRRR